MQKLTIQTRAQIVVPLLETTADRNHRSNRSQLCDAPMPPLVICKKMDPQHHQINSAWAIYREQYLSVTILTQSEYL